MLKKFRKRIFKKISKKKLDKKMWQKEKLFYSTFVLIENEEILKLIKNEMFSFFKFLVF